MLDAFPELVFVASHLGAWQDWEAVREHLLGRPVYMDISYAIDCMGGREARELISSHPQDYVLFGTDSPWRGQNETVNLLRGLDLGREREEKILGRNAARLLVL